MKISKEKAAENRQALIQAASRLFKEKGIDGVGVAEISKAAGLTHGALYAHFSSKDELAAEALGYSAANARERLANHVRSLEDMMDFYMAPAQRDNLSGGCALAAAASEIARQDEPVSVRFMEGYAQMVRYVERELSAKLPPDEARQRAISIVAAMIGGIAVSRSVIKADQAFADEILAAVRKTVGELA
ncbi:TetR/AcrR family transcriptional regulator [Pseudoduganella sp. RAF19]|uniref:TetR/AcrR family transcriptional regulator n=2 Tax=unclassified Pseudoduganella TaxID=2637179 RepID=UPI003F9A99C2